LTIKTTQSLISLGRTSSGMVLAHPAQRENFGTVAGLIKMLRACDQPGDFYDFQRRLFGPIYSAEKRRGQCSRIVKRLKDGKSLPKDAPAPPPLGDPTELASWELEVYVYARIARQLRMVGDGLAWRCFGYDRRVILTLSRNDSSGMLYGKDGLPYELGRIQELWENDRHFALHHDLTNCLRIADLTEFTGDGGALLREIKAKPHTEKKQLDRSQAAVNALMHGGNLPGPRSDARLVQLTELYVTSLRQLGDVIEQAKQDGCYGTGLTQGRALMASSLPAIVARYGEDKEEGGRAIETARQQAIAAAGITMTLHHVKGSSGDNASRSPIMAPWSIYPFAAEDCAALICDLLVFETTTSGDALIASLERAGLRAELLLQPSNGLLAGDMDVLRAYLGNGALTWHAHGLNLLLFELVEPDTLARGTREVLSMANPPSEPVMTYSHEAETWLPAVEENDSTESTP